MPIVAMPDGVKVRFPDDMPVATIRSLITSKYPNAQRDALDKTGVKPYQNVMQGLGTALGNIPAQIGMGMSATEQAMAEGLRDVVDPNAAAMNPPVPPTWNPNRPVDAGPNMPPPGTPGQPGAPGQPPGWLQQAGAAASGVIDSIVPGAKVLQAVGPSVVQAGLGLIPGAREAISSDLTADAANAQKNFAHAQSSVTPTDMRPGSWEDYTATGLASAAGMAPGLVASIITKSPAPMMAQAGIEANAAYGEARQLGLSPEQARQYASAKVVPSVIGASVSAGPLLKEGVGVFQRVITEALVNTGVSASTEMLSAAADLAYTNPALSVAEIADRVKKAAIIGGVTGGALGGMAAIGHGKAADAVAPDTVVPPTPVVHPTVEDSVKLPGQLQLAGPGPQLRLPAPAADSAVPRRPNSTAPSSTPPAGSIRYYHGADDTAGADPASGGSRGVTPDPNYAEGYRQNGVPRNTYFVDIPKADAIGMGLYDEVNDHPIIGKVPESVAQRMQLAKPATVPPTPEASPDYQAQLAVQKTKQVETKALLDTARQTITSLGSFSKEEAGGPVAQRVGVWRSRLGMPIDAPITVEDMARAGVPQPAIDALVALRRPLVQGVTITPSDVVAAAEAKNLIHSDANFKELAYRTTGSRDVSTMSQTQLNALRATLDAMPAHETPVTVPIADRAPFDEGQYSKAVDAVRAQGRYTLQAIKDATGLKGNREAAAVRDAMVRRGQLVQRSPTDFRLYDVLGAERQPVPDDVPIGVMQDHVVRELPVNTIRIRQDGKSLGSFNSAGEARAKIRALREAEAAGGTRSQIAIEPGAETAHAVLQNRYDAQGNLLGQVPVSTHRTAAEANAEASRLNTPDTGPTYTQTNVTPASRSSDAPVTPVSRKVAPAALAGRMDEILGKLNQIVDQRKLGLLGAKVRLTSKVRAVGFGDQHVEGAYAHKLITVAAGHLSPEMSTDEVVHSLAGVIDHELVHALKAAGVLGPETEGWRTIVKYAERSKRPGSSETYMEFAQRQYTGKPGYETRADIEEEAIAEAFRHWAANRRNVAGKPATVFSQIVQWFKNLRSAVPHELFTSIESGRLVEDALRPPGAEMPRAKAASAMAQARADIAAAEQVPAKTDAEQAAKDNLLRVKSRAFLHAREQAREDRAGRSGPKTVLGTTPSAAFESGDIMPRADVSAIVERFKADSGTQANRLQTYLPLDPAYMNRVADAQEATKHAPDAPAVAKAYNALTAETKTMFKALGPLEVSAWTGDGAPYADPAAMLADVKAGQLKLRLSKDLFGPGARNAGHPMHADSGYKTTDGQPLSNNDLFRIVHDVYGHGQSGFRNDPRGAYNAYHEHARLLSSEARRALATETLAQDAWASHGPHLRRRDGTVPDADAIDYLPPEAREFAQQKAFVLPDELLSADPGLRAAAEAEAAQNEEPKFSVGDDPVKDDLPGGRFYGKADRSPGGAMTKPATPSPQLTVPIAGAEHFGGPTAEAQLEMARTGEQGATMLYLSPAQFEQLSRHGAHPEQETFNALAAEGYKFRGFPSLVVDGYAGAVRVADSDAGYSAHALAALGVDKIPVVVYPKRGESLGLVTALEGPNRRLAWPGTQEFDPAQRNDPIAYDFKAAFGERVPREDAPPRWSINEDEAWDFYSGATRKLTPGERADAAPAPGEPPPPQDHNIVQQRVDGWIGKALHDVGRSKRNLRIPFTGSIFDARIVFQDKMLSWDDALERLKAAGGKVNDANDVYMAEQLYHGKVFEQVQQREQNLHLPLLNAMRASGTKLGELGSYLYARHVPERNAYLRTRGSESDNPAGMSDRQATDILDKFAKEGKTPELEKLAQMVYKINADTTRTRVEAGLISQKAADSSPYKYYVSLRGNKLADLDPDESTMLADRRGPRARSGKGFSVGGREERGVTGRHSEAQDILSGVFLQNIEAVIRAEKNRVPVALARLLHENPDAGVGKFEPTAPTRKIAGDNGMIRETGDPSYRQDPSIVTAKIGGREIIMRLADDRLARAIKSDYVSFSHPVLQGFIDTLGKINRFKAQTITSWSPNFLPQNLIRDLLHTSILGQQYDVPGFTKHVVGNVPAAMNGIREVLFTGKAEGEWAKAYKEMTADGGTVEFMGINDLANIVKKTQRAVENQSANPTLRQAREHMEGFFKVVENTNKVIENGIRLSAYMAARKAGVSRPQAAFIGKNITVNFNKGGELKSVMNSLYMFYGAGVNGFSMVAKGLKNGRVQKMVGGVILAGAAQDILNRMVPQNQRDKNGNGVPDYDEIDDYTLEHNIIVPNVFGLGDKPYFKLVMPQVFNAFWNAGRNVAAVTSGSPARTPGHAASSIIGTFIDSANPLGGANSLLNFLSPTLTDPVVDITTNRNFADVPIVPEQSPYGVQKPMSQRYWNATGEVPRAISEHLNSLAGGNSVRSSGNWFTDISPEHLQYVFDYATGGLGGVLQGAAGIAGDLMNHDSGHIKTNQIPIVKNFVVDPGNRSNTQMYFTARDAVQTYQAEIKAAAATDKSFSISELRQKHPVEAKLAPALDAAETVLSDLRKQIRDVRANDKLAPAVRHAREDALQKRADARMAQFNKAYFAAQGYKVD